MPTRSQEHKDFILSNLEETYYIENFISKEDIETLCMEYYGNINKVYKNTGPITSDIKHYNSPVLYKIVDKISKLYPNSKVMSGMFFEVNQPHIIHNDDKHSLPLTYKAFNIPLEYDTEEEPHLCFFDQVYLDGPSKFFNGEENIETFYNTIVYDYENVVDKSDIPIDAIMKEKYLTHLEDKWLKGLSFNSAHAWQPGNAIVFDCVRLHCGSNFKGKKLGLSIFTEYL